MRIEMIDIVMPAESPVAGCEYRSIADIALVKSVDDGSIGLDPGQKELYKSVKDHMNQCSVCKKNYKLMDENYKPKPSLLPAFREKMLKIKYC